MKLKELVEKVAEMYKKDPKCTTLALNVVYKANTSIIIEDIIAGGALKTKYINKEMRKRALIAYIANWISFELYPTPDPEKITKKIEEFLKINYVKITEDVIDEAYKSINEIYSECIEEKKK